METREAFSHYTVVDTPYGSSRVPKAIHLTEEEAWGEAERMSFRSRWVHNAYRCRECGWWHVGTVRNYARAE